MLCHMERASGCHVRMNAGLPFCASQLSQQIDTPVEKDKKIRCLGKHVIFYINSDAGLHLLVVYESTAPDAFPCCIINYFF